MVYDAAVNDGPSWFFNNKNEKNIKFCFSFLFRDLKETTAKSLYDIDTDYYYYVYTFFTKKSKNGDGFEFFLGGQMLSIMKKMIEMRQKMIKIKNDRDEKKTQVVVAILCAPRLFL